MLVYNFGGWKVATVALDIPETACPGFHFYSISLGPAESSLSNRECGKSIRQPAGIPAKEFRPWLLPLGTFEGKGVDLWISLPT